MGAIIIVGAILYVIVKVAEDASLHQVPEGTDLRASIIDASKNNLSKRELRRRLMNGYYVNK